MTRTTQLALETGSVGHKFPDFSRDLAHSDGLSKRSTPTNNWRRICTTVRFEYKPKPEKSIRASLEIIAAATPRSMDHVACKIIRPLRSTHMTHDPVRMLTSSTSFKVLRKTKD
ncbi:hypothetical protein KC19_9G009400 [Ceratodon purpureus]|uniref:Uncharacterized protein n=1 Tax=Ceratodon purpureus TaxID=3225 RepID=A0A8T0GP90_CERPU|nr:hypothetical protein KC19_9G009400 [Ceratodon purpureus]